MSEEIEVDECGVETQDSWAKRRIAKHKELIGIAIGEASMCWEPHPAGVFDSSRAMEIADKLFQDLR